MGKFHCKKCSWVLLGTRSKKDSQATHLKKFSLSLFVGGAPHKIELHEHFHMQVFEDYFSICGTLFLVVFKQCNCIVNCISNCIISCNKPCNCINSRMNAVQSTGLILLNDAMDLN